MCSLSIKCCTASTTMMASSTTIPMASTKPNMVSVLMVKPNGIKKQKVPNMETGIASTGIKVDRQFCKKRNTTKATSASACSNVFTTSFIDTLIIVTPS